MNSFEYDDINKCYLINFNDVILKIGNDILSKFLFDNKYNLLNWKYDNKGKLYSIYLQNTNGKRISIYEYVFNISHNSYDITFLNNDMFDIRNDNIIYKQVVDETIVPTNNLIKDINIIQILEYCDGFLCDKGTSAGKIINPYWKVKINNNNGDDEIFYIMYCGGVNYTYISLCDINLVRQKKAAWYKTTNGYIGQKSKDEKIIYMQQCITDNYLTYNNNSLAIYHKNGNKYDNRRFNLLKIEK